MRLATSTLIIVALPVLVMGAVLHLTIVGVVEGRFATLERERTVDIAARLHGLVANRLDHLATLATDYAWWDDSIAFVTAPNQAFIDATFVPTTFITLDIDACRLRDHAGTVAFAGAHLPASAPDQLSVFPAHLNELIGPLEAAAASGTDTATVISTDSQAWLAAVSSIRTSDGDGPSRGSLVMLQRLTPARLEAMAASLGNGLMLEPQTPPRSGWQLDNGGWVREGADYADIFLPLSDAAAGPSLRSRMQRSLHQQGQAIAVWLAVALALIAVVAIGMMWGLLRVVVVGRVARMAGVLKPLAQTGTTSLRVNDERGDEIGALGRAIDRALAAVESSATHAERAQQEAEQAAAVTSATLAHLSHEIRTPLNGIAGMSRSMLDRSDLDAELRETARTIDDSAGALKGLLDDVLDMARIDAGEFRVTCEEVMLGNALRRAGALFVASAKRQGIDMIASISSDCPTLVSADANRLHQVLLNLIGNAMKFTRRGHICLAARADGKQHVIIEVIDTGIGMDAEQTAGIFQRYNQASDSVSDRFGGTGLGLTLSRHLIEAMEGSVSVTSTPGRGSSFSVRLRAISGTAVHRSSSVAIAKWTTPALAWGGRTAGAGQTGLADLERPTSAAAVARRLASDPRLPLIIDLGAGSQPLLDLIDHAKSELSDRPCVVLAPPDPHGAWLGPHLDHHSQVLPAGADANQIHQALVVAAGHYTEPTRHERFRGGQRILVIDDSAVNRQVAEATLKRIGLEVLTASSAEAGLLMWRVEQPDAILMDCRMPGTNGLEATRQIRAQEGNRRVPIVALTADNNPAQHEACLAAGMDDVLLKPIDETHLFQVMTGHLETIDADIAEAVRAAKDTGSAVTWDIETRIHKLLADVQADGCEAVLEAFIEEQAATYAALVDALEADDHSVIADAAHRLQGIAGNVGLSAVARAASRLEEHANAPAGTRQPLHEELDQALTDGLSELVTVAGSYGITLRLN